MVQSCTSSSCFAISSLNKSLKEVRLQFPDGFIQYFLIHFKSHLHHEPALFATQHIPCAPDIQVPHGNLETAAQITVLLQGLQPFSGISRQGSQRRRQQITKCFFIASAHPATQLVQITQSKLMGIIVR